MQEKSKRRQREAVCVLMGIVIGALLFFMYDTITTQKATPKSTKEDTTITSMIKAEKAGNGKSLYWSGAEGTIEDDADDKLLKGEETKEAKLESFDTNMGLRISSSDAKLFDETYLLDNTEHDFKAMYSDRQLYVESALSYEEVVTQMKENEQVCSLPQSSPCEITGYKGAWTGIYQAFDGTEMIGFSAYYEKDNMSYYVEYIGLGNYSEIAEQMEEIANHIEEVPENE